MLPSKLFSIMNCNHLFNRKDILNSQNVEIDKKKTEKTSKKFLGVILRAFLKALISLWLTFVFFKYAYRRLRAGQKKLQSTAERASRSWYVAFFPPPFWSTLVLLNFMAVLH